MLRPKGKGSGIMVSDFVDKHSGFLALTDKEFAKAQKSNPTLEQKVRQLLEYGESRDGYWTSSKFMKQIEKAVAIAEVKGDGWKHVWVFG